MLPFKGTLVMCLQKGKQHSSSSGTTDISQTVDSLDSPSLVDPKKLTDPRPSAGYRSTGMQHFDRRMTSHMTFQLKEFSQATGTGSIAVTVTGPVDDMALHWHLLHQWIGSLAQVSRNFIRLSPVSFVRRKPDRRRYRAGRNRTMPPSGAGASIKSRIDPSGATSTSRTRP